MSELPRNPDTNPLRRLVMLRPGASDERETEGLPEAPDPPLAPRGRREVLERGRHWEWTDGVFSSPLRRARESARLLIDEPDCIAVLHELRPMDPGETPEELRTRVAGLLRRLRQCGLISPLLVAHGDVIRAIVEQETGAQLPPGRPGPGELVLLTRVHDGPFRLGRRSSDPTPLQSSLEREGLSGDEAAHEERHVAHLELRSPH